MDVTERQALTRAVDKLNAMDKCGDPEELHARAEDAICELLTEIGFGKAAKAFEDANSRVGFWYA